MTHPASQHLMQRWCFAALLVIALTSLLIPGPAFAQFGGRFPGSGGRYPGGQQGPNSTQQNKDQVYGPTETLTGSLRDISATDLVIDAGDDRIVLVQLQSGTKYLSTMGKVKASDFEPGDHVTVEAIRDSSDHYHSKTITLNKKGSAEDKAAAAQAASASSHSGGGSSAGPSDSDPDRPRLHRSDSTGDSSGSTTASAQPSDSRAVPANAGSSASAGSAAPGTTGSATTTSRRPSAAPPAADDSGPPVLRRGTTPSASSPDPQVASSRTSDSPRPSLSAEDVNGVTRVPVVPPPGQIGDGAGEDRITGRAGSGDGLDPVIEQARDAASTFSETLPNYVVKQITNRYQTGAAGRGRTSWQPLDIVTTDLIYEDGKERYTNILVNGKPTRDILSTGSWSEGEFGSMLQAILAPATYADFRNQRSVTILNRTAWRYDYTVEQARSTWNLRAEGRSLIPSYTGSLWVDKATYRVLRIEIAARNLPRDFPMDTVESSIDYDFVVIGDQKVLLPSQSDSLSCMRGTSDCTKNHTEYHNYKKYGAETNITFEGTPDK
jgi:hypothetical protein